MGFAATSAVDIVGIFDSNFTQLFVDARVINASVNESAKLMEHPVEDGTTIVDHKVIMPVEIDFSLILKEESFRDTYSDLKQAFIGSDTFSIQTLTDTYYNMAFVSMPHTETPDMIGTVAVALKMREVQIVAAVFESLPPSSVKAANDADTKSRGAQSPQPETEEKSGQRVGLLKGWLS